MYMRRRLRVAQEGQRRSIFLRYLGEVAAAVSQINGMDKAKLYEQLLVVAKKKTAEADVKLDDRGRPIQDEEELELGDNCIIVPQVVPGRSTTSETESSPPAKAARSRRAKSIEATGGKAAAAAIPGKRRPPGARTTARRSRR
jgi:hypothetical protein